MSNFDLDLELDEALFSTEVPAGYTLTRKLDLDKLEGKQKSTNEAEKVEEVFALWADGRKDEAVRTLLEIDWLKPITFSKKSYFFSLTEKEYIALKEEDQQRVMREVMGMAGRVRPIVKEVLRLGQAALSAQDYEKAEKRLDTGLQLGRLLTSRHESMLIVRLAGIAVQKMTLTEMNRLYAETNNNEKLRVVEEELQALEVKQKEIKEGLTGQ